MVTVKQENERIGLLIQALGSVDIQWVVAKKIEIIELGELLNGISNKPCYLLYFQRMRSNSYGSVPI